LWLHQELYVGSNNFHVELSQSCGEFYHELQTLLGITHISYVFLNKKIGQVLGIDA
jgi:hypothetical protein